jgi:pilus assembly protein CpaE
MHRSLIIGADFRLTSRLAEMIRGTGLPAARTLDNYPSEQELTSVLRTFAPHLVFVSAGSVHLLSATLEVLGRVAPGVQPVAIHTAFDSQLLLQVMRAGVREIIAYPFEHDELRSVIGRAVANFDKNPVAYDATELLFSFFPSKAGVGASTIALNTATALSKLSDKPALLIDFDLNSGMVGFMLKLKHPHSVIEAVEHAEALDESMWEDIVAHAGKLDVLHSGGLNPHHRLEPLQVRHFIEFSRRNYRVVCADLSGNLERFSLEVMQQSKAVFVVCTPELPSLHLAREKCRYLESLDLGDKVRILLNRSLKRMLISPTEIERLIGRPVQMTFPNDYAGIHKALTDGNTVAASSDFAKQCESLARTLLEGQLVQATNTGKRRFVEYFSIAPARYRFAGKE